MRQPFLSIQTLAAWVTLFLVFSVCCATGVQRSRGAQQAQLTGSESLVLRCDGYGAVDVYRVDSESSKVLSASLDCESATKVLAFSSPTNDFTLFTDAMTGLAYTNRTALFELRASPNRALTRLDGVAMVCNQYGPCSLTVSPSEPQSVSIGAGAFSFYCEVDAVVSVQVDGTVMGVESSCTASTSIEIPLPPVDRRSSSFRGVTVSVFNAARQLSNNIAFKPYPSEKFSDFDPSGPVLCFGDNVCSGMLAYTWRAVVAVAPVLTFTCPSLSSGMHIHRFNVSRGDDVVEAICRYDTATGSTVAGVVRGRRAVTSGGSVSVYGYDAASEAFTYTTGWIPMSLSVTSGAATASADCDGAFTCTTVTTADFAATLVVDEGAVHVVCDDVLRSGIEATITVTAIDNTIHTATLFCSPFGILTPPFQEEGMTLWFSTNAVATSPHISERGFYIPSGVFAVGKPVTFSALEGAPVSFSSALCGGGPYATPQCVFVYATGGGGVVNVVPSTSVPSLAFDCVGKGAVEIEALVNGLYSKVLTLSCGVGAPSFLSGTGLFVWTEVDGVHSVGTLFAGVVRVRASPLRALPTLSGGDYCSMYSPCSLSLPLSTPTLSVAGGTLGFRCDAAGTVTGIFPEGAMQILRCDPLMNTHGGTFVFDSLDLESTGSVKFFSLSIVDPSTDAPDSYLTFAVDPGYEPTDIVGSSFESCFGSTSCSPPILYRGWLRVVRVLYTFVCTATMYGSYVYQLTVGGYYMSIHCSAAGDAVFLARQAPFASVTADGKGVQWGGGAQGVQSFSFTSDTAIVLIDSVVGGPPGMQTACAGKLACSVDMDYTSATVYVRRDENAQTIVCEPGHVDPLEFRLSMYNAAGMYYSTILSCPAAGGYPNPGVVIGDPIPDDYLYLRPLMSVSSPRWQVASSRAAVGREYTIEMIGVGHVTAGTTCSTATRTCSHVYNAEPIVYTITRSTLGASILFKCEDVGSFKLTVGAPGSEVVVLWLSCGLGGIVSYSTALNVFERVQHEGVLYVATTSQQAFIVREGDGDFPAHLTGLVERGWCKYVGVCSFTPSSASPLFSRVRRPLALYFDEGELLLHGADPSVYGAVEAYATSFSPAHDEDLEG